mgnify:CR=1 FL=1
MSYLVHGWSHKKKEHRTKKESPIEEKCSCGSGSFLMRKEFGKEKWICRRCGNEVNGKGE